MSQDPSCGGWRASKRRTKRRAVVEGESGTILGQPKLSLKRIEVPPKLKHVLLCFRKVDAHGADCQIVVEAGIWFRNQPGCQCEGSSYSGVLKTRNFGRLSDSVTLVTLD